MYPRYGGGGGNLTYNSPVRIQALAVHLLRPSTGVGKNLGYTGGFEASRNGGHV